MGANPERMTVSFFDWFWNVTLVPHVQGKIDELNMLDTLLNGIIELYSKKGTQTVCEKCYESCRIY